MYSNFEWSIDIRTSTYTGIGDSIMSSIFYIMFLKKLRGGYPRTGTNNLIHPFAYIFRNKKEIQWRTDSALSS